MQTDGQLKTGRDVVVAALLGAEEFGFATAPLVVSGCIMMRVCHLDTCPVGVATQNPELRKRFTGKPEFVVTFFEFIAEEVREHLAALGFRTLEEADRARRAARHAPRGRHWKALGLDLAPLLHRARLPRRQRPHRTTRAGPRAGEGARPHADRAGRRRARARRAGADRRCRCATSTAPSARCSATRSPSAAAATGLPDDTIDITLTGSAGQSFGAFLPRGITLRLIGDANDYLGKGLSGGRIVRPPATGRPRSPPSSNIIAGNVDRLRRHRRRDLPARAGRRAVLRAQLRRHRGRRGRRRPRLRVHDRRPSWSSSAGPVATSRAGMSGGMAYVLDLRPGRVNPEMVDLEPLDARRRGAGCATLVAAAPRGDRLGRGAAAAAGLGRPRSARFTKVMPRDYAAGARGAAAGGGRGLDLDGDEVWNRIMEASRG